MKQIVVEAIHLENFKSFTQPTCVQLSTIAGLKFLSGKNLIEPRLGSNGAGKSTLLDALVWCFYSSGVQGQRAVDLTSWGGKSPRVQVDLKIGGQAVSVTRNGSPNRLSVNGVAASQEYLESLLSLSKDRFLQSVVFGQDSPRFLDLSTAARGELLQGVLGLELWDDLSEVASRQAGLLSQQETSLERELAFALGKLEGLEDETSLQRALDNWQAAQENKINDVIEQIAGLEADIMKLQTGVRTTLTELRSLPEIDQMDLDIRAAQVCLQQIDELEEKIRFYKNNKICPVCQQSTTTSHCDEYVAGLTKKLASYPDEDIENNTLVRLMQQRAGMVILQRQLAHALEQDKASIRAKSGQIELLADMVEKTDKETNPFIHRLQELRTTRQETQSKLSELQAQQLQVQGEWLKVKYWVQGFKKIRLYQIKQILLRLEVETANAASALGIPDWKIKYVTETENKSGTMRQGIQILLETPAYRGSWTGFSGGETQRIRLAVTLGLASMIQGMAGVTYNIEIFDESSQYLSVEGVEDLLICLNNRAEITQKSVWVVDHTALSFGGFTEIWQVIKDKDGSHVEQVACEH